MSVLTIDRDYETRSELACQSKTFWAMKIIPVKVWVLFDGALGVVSALRATPAFIQSNSGRINNLVSNDLVPENPIFGGRLACHWFFVKSILNDYLIKKTRWTFSCKPSSPCRSRGKTLSLNLKTPSIILPNRLILCFMLLITAGNSM